MRIGLSLCAVGLMAVSFGCGPKADFSTSAPINEQTPQAAIYPIFGTAIEEDESGFAFLASDDPNLCQTIRRHGGFEEFLEAIVYGEADVVLVGTLLKKEGDLPRSGESLRGGYDAEIISFFAVSDGEEPIVLSVDNEKGTLATKELSETAFSGKWSSKLVREEVDDRKINVLLQGTVHQAPPCRELDRFLEDNFNAKPDSSLFPGFVFDGI